MQPINYDEANQFINFIQKTIKIVTEIKTELRAGGHKTYQNITGNGAYVTMPKAHSGSTMLVKSLYHCLYISFFKMESHMNFKLIRASQKA